MLTSKIINNKIPKNNISYISFDIEPKVRFPKESREICQLIFEIAIFFDVLSGDAKRNVTQKN